MRELLKEITIIDPITKIKSFLSDELLDMAQVINSRIEKRSEIIPIVAKYIFSAGGKKVRPILTILSAKLFGYKGTRHINLAAAVEFIHTATLLHDDVVDESDLRRGRQTANNKWDNKSSILVGDYLFSQAFCIMAEDGDIKILNILSKASSIIAEGEVMQISSKSNLNMDFDDYLKVISSKTAELFAAACQVGGAIAQKEQIEQESLYNFGLNLGIAFQIMDDILDYSSKETSMGKAPGDDFREGKVTLPIILLLKKCNHEERTFLERNFVELIQEKQNFNRLVLVLNKYKILEETKQVANFYIGKAKDSLLVIEDSEVKNLLLEILEFAAKRTY